MAAERGRWPAGAAEPREKRLEMAGKPLRSAAFQRPTKTKAAESFLGRRGGRPKASADLPSLLINAPA